MVARWWPKKYNSRCGTGSPSGYTGKPFLGRDDEMAGEHGQHVAYGLGCDEVSECVEV